MKKIFIGLITLAMILCFSACGKSSDNAEDKSASATQTEPASQTTDDENNNTEKATDKSSTKPDVAQDNKKILVVYFSATHTTQGVAEKIASGLDADLYEIKPEDPYTDEDLNYNDNNSRSTVEMNDPDARPGISGTVENMDQYKTVFVGYPIWWGEAPRIISTFMESYDFTGKTIIPFCTSGGSGIGSSAANLEKLTSGANWLEGKRFNGNDSENTIMEWVNTLGLTD